MPTWTLAGEQDDITWGEATISGNQATLGISFSDHNFEYGAYTTHIYANDLAGNSVSCPVVVDIPAVLANAPVSGKVEQNTYFIASALNKDFVLDVSAASMENNANVQLWFTVGSAKNQMWQISDTDGDGYYTIVSLNSGKALEAAGAGTTDGTNVQQYERNGTDAQLWKLEENADGTYLIRNKNSGLALDLFTATLDNGQNIQLYTPNNTAAQKWYLIPADVTGPEITNIEYSEISAEGFRVTCTVSDVSGIQKVEFPTWTKHNGQDDQKWHEAAVTGTTATCYISISDHNFEPGDYEVHIYTYDTLGNSHAIVAGGVTVPNRIGSAPVSGKLESGTYFIASAQNQNFVVDVEGISAENSANVYLWETMGSNRNQMWMINDADGDGYYTAVAVHSGKYMDVEAGSSANDTNVQQYEATNSDAQLWQIVPNDDGTYSFYSMCGGLALDLFYGWVGNGVNIRIHEPNGAAAQKWYLIPAKLSEDTSHIHTRLTSVVTEPTCTEAGYTTHTCANCGVDYTADYVDATGHNYEDGTCTVCGEADPGDMKPSVQHALTLKYPALTFEDVITMNVFFAAENIQDVVEMGLITYKSQVSEWNVDNAESVVPGYVWNESEGLYSASTQGIAAKDMGDTYWFAVYAKLADGTYTYTRLVSYSPTTYAYNQLGDPAMSKLVVAMLNYGAAAQVYFGYKTNSLMNAGLTEAQKASVETYRADMMDGISTVTAEKSANFRRTATGFTKRYPTVTFEGAFSIDYLCQPSATVQGNITLYYWDQNAFDAADVLSTDNATGALTMEQSGDLYTASVEGVAAKDLDKGIYVAFVYTDGEADYCSGVLATPSACTARVWPPAPMPWLPSQPLPLSMAITQSRCSTDRQQINRHNRKPPPCRF